uniref:Uncharacterized protein n=1 Tax=Rhizophora mucronata TaxID=61149 RepID=A0A2P2QYD8_RHIMU
MIPAGLRAFVDKTLVLTFCSCLLFRIKHPVQPMSHACFSNFLSLKNRDNCLIVGNNHL